jgi:ElaB/YqjD/DUF883 family membrane-anchored ribosome-binding protein
MNQPGRISNNPNSTTEGDSIDEATKAVKDKASEISGQMTSTVEAISDSATQQIKTFASELERMGKNNPLGMIAGAVIVGVVIGLLGRGRT